MDLKDTIIAILSKNHNPEKYKTDSRIKALALRAVHELVHAGILNVDAKGKLLNHEFEKIPTLSNYSLLKIVENAILSRIDQRMPDNIISQIESIDYLGKCWHSPKEVAAKLEAITLQRHNKRKMEKFLYLLVKEGICIKTTNKAYARRYRISYCAPVK